MHLYSMLSVKIGHRTGFVVGVDVGCWVGGLAASDGRKD